ncbi:LysE family transporter [Caballeronia sp. AZ1_KS37]|uniref:LysE family translocator n=1 Tax=Caballeronia sp. AZ1_KS37 TaxID=2921756 RepID=UPI002028310D|nr:LysE family transporter [Caballeronia sp. AZ1_KS37]
MLAGSSPILFVLGSIALLLTPGPTNTLLAAGGLRCGIRRSAILPFSELLGYLTSISAWGLLIENLPNSLSWISFSVRCVSSGYIALLAIRMWRTAGLISVAQRDFGFSTIFFATLSNPKAMLFAGTIFPRDAFLDLAVYTKSMSIFAIILVPIGIGWISLGAMLNRDRSPSSRLCPERVQRCASIVLGAFAIFLAYGLIR